MKFNKIGVIGAGVMGVGVAQNLAQTGHDVVLVDLDNEVLGKARNEIEKGVRFGRMYTPDLDNDTSSVMPRIQFTTDYQQLHDVQFVVENVVEKWDVKKEVYPQLDTICPPETVFAANTSCISITRIGSITNRPDRIVGIHFMNPVPLKPTVEMIRGYHTTQESLDTAEAFLASMGKSCVIVNDSPGFVSNRVLMLTINEAAYLIHDQVADPAAVDRIFKECFGHTMGPLATADLIGLDTILFSIDVLYESFKDSKYRPCPLLQKMVDAGLHGRKSGEGFYKYVV